MSDDLSDSLIKFQNDKSDYEFEKTLILQKDEVKRLKDELRLVNLHVSDSQKHFSQIIRTYKKRAKSIKKEIESVPISTSIIQSKLISSHTKTINKIKHEHHKTLDGIRIQYSEQLKSTKISGASSQFFFGENSDYDQLNDATIYQNFKNAELYEIEVQSKIQVLNQQIAQQLLRSEELEEEIDKLKETINKEHQQYSLYYSINDNHLTTQKHIRKVKKRNGHSQQNLQNLKYYQEEIQNIENKYKNDEANIKKTFIDELDQIRQKINQVRKKSQELKLRIDTKNTDSSPELNQSIQSLSNLQAIYQQMQEVSNVQIPAGKEIRVNKKILKQTIIQLQVSVDDLNEIQKEHDSLLEEIKRLDFMIYGRRGKFQKYFKPKKRNIWIC